MELSKVNETGNAKTGLRIVVFVEFRDHKFRGRGAPREFSPCVKNLNSVLVAKALNSVSRNATRCSDFSANCM